MASNKTRWGIFLFLFSPLLVGSLVFISLKFPYASNKLLYCGVAPVLGIVFSLGSFFIGHVSYPRVHNLKVYLIGYLLGIVGLGYFLLFKPPYFFPLPAAGSGYMPALYALIAASIVIVLLVPSYVKYRTARDVALALLPVECVILLVLRFSPAAHYWLFETAFPRLLSPELFIGVMFLAMVLLLSVWRIRDEFYLGGILAGAAFLFTASWVSRLLYTPPNALEVLLFPVAPLFLETGILVHWFARMEHRIAYDPLLHIYNRDYCSKIISEQSKLNLTTPLAVAMVDIDHFKNVNDSYGHQAGDLVLYNVAQTISKEVLPAGVVCRYGGEELVVFFPQKTAAQALPIVENMRQVIEKTKTKTGKKSLTVTVSCGISCREDMTQSIIDVIQAADKALYKAKEGGRNQVKSGKTSVRATGK
jgi:diguanylate cyclase (GGDEF)-like protein